MDGTTPASDLIKADVTINAGVLYATTTFKNRYVAVGDLILYSKVMYHITGIQQTSKHTQITANEA